MRAQLRAAAEFVAALSVVAALLFAVLTLWEPVRVAGLSMSPALLPGDLVIVRKAARPRQGSIVLVRASPHGAVLHRVVAIAMDGAITTRGDANPIDDREKVHAAQIVGVVERVIPAGTMLKRWRDSREVGYHDGSTEQHETMTETTQSVAQSEQGWVQR
ncbi:MAG: S24/S26 family peptidase [Coriobacteriia bacterium]